MTITIQIKWTGPYTSVEDIDKNYNNNNNNNGGGLYLITGKIKGQKTIKKQYCGITQCVF